MIMLSNGIPSSLNEVEFLEPVDDGRISLSAGYILSPADCTAGRSFVPLSSVNRGVTQNSKKRIRYFVTVKKAQETKEKGVIRVKLFQDMTCPLPDFRVQGWRCGWDLIPY
jgi:hypothetical protein